MTLRTGSQKLRNIQYERWKAGRRGVKAWRRRGEGEEVERGREEG